MLLQIGSRGLGDLEVGVGDEDVKRGDVVGRTGERGHGGRGVALRGKFIPTIMSALE